jgi:starch phosphorylase
LAAETDLARRLERLGFSDEHSDWAARYLLCEQLVDPTRVRPRQRFEAVAKFIRDLLAHRWVKTRQARERANPKRIYYLSMEFLIGRTLVNNIINLMAEPLVQQALAREGIDYHQLGELEPDAGLGNGGLGRLAACFIDSLATRQYSAMGYGLRYEFGIFRQSLREGYQHEQPDNWLRHPDPWEIARPGKTVQVPLASTIQMQGGHMRLAHGQPSHLLGMAYDRPVVGYGGHCINTLRLWSATSPETFEFADFSHGDFVGAVLKNIGASSLTKVLYPDDSTEEGRTLRFLQEYFLVCCSLHDIIARFRQSGNPQWSALPDKVAIQLNDTHPALAVAELMRILLDHAYQSWDDAWDLTVRTLAYTNHTLLPEALEKWPVELFEHLLPRHLDIIYEINRRFLDDVRVRWPDDSARAARVSLIEEGPKRKVRMAHLAIVGTHSTNGVAAIHSRLLKTKVLPDFAEMFPDRFNNKTNGVTPRRWLLMTNPPLAKLITEAIGEDWITDLSQLQQIVPLADDSSFRAAFRQAKHGAKACFARWLKSSLGQVVDPDSIFDCQVKRIHEYKRQLLNVLQIIVHYNRLRTDANFDAPNRTFLFAGKAAPAYTLAKLIIKLIYNVGEVIDADPAVRGRLRVIFLPNYSVSLSERLIPASNVSEQISTAGYEASGTSNMKFMMNGALTVGTHDGATIEMAEAAGEENFFLFGLTAEQVLQSRGWYDPRWHYEHEPETREALDMIHGDYFSPREPGIFQPIWDTLVTHGDHYMHLADLSAYVETQTRVGQLFGDPEAWSRKAIINVGSSGNFSSDRTIDQYATEIWDAAPCPVP